MLPVGPQGHLAVSVGWVSILDKEQCGGVLVDPEEGWFLVGLAGI